MSFRSKPRAKGSLPLRHDELPQSTLPDDPLTLLWQNAGDRPTGAEAVEAMRARRRNLGPSTAKGRRFRE